MAELRERKRYDFVDELRYHRSFDVCYHAGGQSPTAGCVLGDCRCGSPFFAGNGTEKNSSEKTSGMTAVTAAAQVCGRLR